MMKMHKKKQKGSNGTERKEVVGGGVGWGPHETLKEKKREREGRRLAVARSPLAARAVYVENEA